MEQPMARQDELGELGELGELDELDELYQEVILDHNRRPRNYGPLEDANRCAEGHNPLCGDNITLYLRVENDTVTDVSFEGSGCAIVTASASLMTEALCGKSVEEARALFQSMLGMLTGQEPPADTLADLGKLAVFSGVREYPMRVKCATLVWHTLQAALDAKDKDKDKDALEEPEDTTSCSTGERGA
jgi:nitrogen fixation NifU-like protein